MQDFRLPSHATTLRLTNQTISLGRFFPAGVNTPCCMCIQKNKKKKNKTGTLSTRPIWGLGPLPTKRTMGLYTAGGNTLTVAMQSNYWKCTEERVYWTVYGPGFIKGYYLESFVQFETVAARFYIQPFRSFPKKEKLKNTKILDITLFSKNVACRL